VTKATKSIRLHDKIHKRYKTRAAKNGTSMTYELEKDLP